MTTDSTLEMLAQEFTKGIHIYKGKYRLIPYKQADWFTCCYFSVQRTIHGGLPKDKRNLLREEIFNAIDVLQNTPSNLEEFDKWIYDLFDKITKIHQLTIGQSQKLVNILLKYHYCYYYANIDQNWNERNSFIARMGRFLHVPIDNYVLVQLKDVYKCPKVAINSAGNYATIQINTEYVSWSRLDSPDGYSAYKEIQHFVRNIVIRQPQYASALHFEMQELWIKP